MAVESLRRRRFGTEVSSIWTVRLSVPPARPIRHEAHTVDGTSGIVVTRVPILNREVIVASTVPGDTESPQAGVHLAEPRCRGLVKWVGAAASDTLSNR